MIRGQLITLIVLLIGGLMTVVIVVSYTLHIVHSDRHLSI